MWALPTRWQVARAHLALASGNVPEAQKILGELDQRNGKAPLVIELGAWMELLLGNLERSQELALEIVHENPLPNIRLMLEGGELERAWQHVSSLEGDPRHAAARTMWCGYAHRFELPGVPKRCNELPPGFVRMIWAASPSGVADRAAMTPHELSLLRRQREINMGECTPDYETGTMLTHAAAPFELYGAELEITSALCGGASDSDLKYARRLSQALVAIAPQDPWAILIQAQVDEALGADHLARAKRLAVADRWRGADGDLPLVARLRRRVGAMTITPPEPAPPPPAEEPVAAQDPPEP
jgi:hypothetical protein